MPWRKFARRRRLGRGGAAAVLVVAIGALGQSVAGAASSSSRAPVGVRLERMAPRIPAGSRALGAVDPSTRITLAVSMAPRDEQALTAFIAAASIPGSSAYHHYLAPGAFATRFGPSARTISAVEAHLHALGIQGTSLSRDHLFVTSTASAARVESAFGVELERYRLADGSVGYSDTTAPLVTGVLASASVVGVLGLDGLARPLPLLAGAARARRSARPSAKTRTGVTRRSGNTLGPQACGIAVAAAGTSYSDTQIAKAYELSTLYAAGATGKGQDVALYENEPFLSSDVAAFQRCYRTAVPVSVIKEFGGAGTGPGVGEAILDIDNIIGLAPGVHLLVYEGPANNDAQWVGEYDDMVAPDNAKSLSTSWGLCEQEEGAATIDSEYSVFQEAGADGETFYAAAGDTGSEDCFRTDHDAKALAVDDPASDPYVVSVGGVTLLSLAPTEKVWNNCGHAGACATTPGDGAGGGGISTAWLMPTWQIGAGVINKYSSKTNCGITSRYYCRELPDVSGDADDLRGGWEIFYAGGWAAEQGGTSAAAPLWAAVTAVINSQCKTGSVGFDAPRLYEVARTPGNFTDVTSGDNDFIGAHSGAYPATVGYDMASGLGSPLAAGLAKSLC